MSATANKTFDVLIEIPKGSRNKYEYDFDLHKIRFDRMLFSSMMYPADYGFIPETLALDGDPLDVLVLGTEPTFPMCVMEVKPHTLKEIEHFFQVYKDLEKKRVDVEGWGDAQEAYDIWHACIERYNNSEHKAKGDFTI